MTNSITVNTNKEIVNQLTAINTNLEALTAAMLLQVKQLERLTNLVDTMYDESTDSLRVKQK